MRGRFFYIIFSALCFCFLISPRVIRDKESQLGKGFAYVLLADQKSVYSALQLHDKPFNKRKLRVLVCGKRFKDKRVGRDSCECRNQSGRARNRNDSCTVMVISFSCQHNPKC